MHLLELYELCVQSPRHLTGFLRALHGQNPRILREDFCGSAALSRRWIEDGQRQGVICRALGTDLDVESLEWARSRIDDPQIGDCLTLRVLDAITAPVLDSDGCDIVFVGNFSMGYINTRQELIEYLRSSHKRLAMGNAGFGGGIFVCDTFDGPNAFAHGSFTRQHPSRGREMVRYTWEQRETDILTRRVECAIHFQVDLDGEITQRIRDGFVYHWRVWSMAELVEAMREVGFTNVEVHQDVSEHPSPMVHGRELKDSGIVCVVGRA